MHGRVGLASPSKGCTRNTAFTCRPLTSTWEWLPSYLGCSKIGPAAATPAGIPPWLEGKECWQAAGRYSVQCLPDFSFCLRRKGLGALETQRGYRNTFADTAWKASESTCDVAQQGASLKHAQSKPRTRLRSPGGPIGSRPRPFPVNSSSKTHRTDPRA